MQENEIQSLQKRFETLKNDASVWISSWKELKYWIRPTRGKFEGDTVNDGSELENQDNINNTPQLATRIFASGMYSGVTNPSRNWFKFITDMKEQNESQTVKIWLEELEDKVRSIFVKSNIYQSYKSIYEELFVFATTAALIIRDYEDVVRLRTFTVGEYFLGNDSRGKANTFCREFSMTVCNLVEEFGEGNVSDRVLTMYRNKQHDDLITVRHMICPRKYINPEKKDNKNMPFASYYWEQGSNENKFLSESGYLKFPVISSPWDQIVSSDVYGKSSPGWEMLSDVKQLQVMEKDKLINSGKFARPAYLVDSEIEDYDLNLNPDGITRFNPANGSVGVKTIEVQPLDPRILDKEAVIERINKTGYVNLFMMFSQSEDSRMTATEVIKRDSEKMLALSPVLENINNNLISPLIQYTVELILEGGLVSDPPEELAGKTIKIEYISIIAQAQKMVGTNSIEQLASFTGNMSAVFPDIVDNFDSDEAYTAYGEKLGVPARIIRGKEKVAAIREGRTRQAQEQQAMQNAMATVQGAKVLSDTQIRPNTALTALTGGA